MIYNNNNNNNNFNMNTNIRYIYIYIVLLVKQLIYIYIYRQHFFVNANFIKHNTYFMSTYFLLDPFKFLYYFYRIRGELIYVLSIVVYIPSTCPTTQLRKILTDNTTILKHQNNKQKLQILEALHIRNLQPTLNRIHFQTSANVLKCL